jgi:hypothetical protein
MEDESGQDAGTHGVKSVLEGRHNPEVATASPHGPEETFIFVRACPDEPTVGGDDLHREEVVSGPAMFPGEVSKAAA